MNWTDLLYPDISGRLRAAVRVLPDLREVVAGPDQSALYPVIDSEAAVLEVLDGVSITPLTPPGSTSSSTLPLSCFAAIPQCCHSAEEDPFTNKAGSRPARLPGV